MPFSLPLSEFIATILSFCLITLGLVAVILCEDLSEVLVLGLLGPYITSIALIIVSVNPLLLLLYPCNPHFVIIVPLN